MGTKKGETVLLLTAALALCSPALVLLGIGFTKKSACGCEASPAGFVCRRFSTDTERALDATLSF
jgi:hypothetical protein